MADTKISALTAGSALGGTEVVPGVQSAADVKITATQIKDFIAAYTSTGGPYTMFPAVSSYLPLSGTALTLSSMTAQAAANERRAVVGKVYMADRGAGGARTISNAGGKIHWLPGTTTFANAGTSLDIGIQDVSVSAGPTPQPDGTFNVKATYVGGTDTITASAWNSAAMESGTKTITHGDLISIVFDMTARGGADSVIQQMVAGGQTSGWPVSNTYTAAAWAASGITGAIICAIEFDDGTFATLFGIPPLSALTAEVYSDATNPDERGNVFRVPFNCKVGGFRAFVKPTDATSDFTVAIYSDPFGTPAVVSGSSVTVLAETVGKAGSTLELWIPLAAEVTLQKNTDYVIAVKADGAGNVAMTAVSVANANYKNLMISGGATVSKTTRNNGTGAFAAATPTSFYPLFLELSKILVG